MTYATLGTATCDVWLVGRKVVCKAEAPWPFKVVCLCGHEISGMACDVCLAAGVLGCLACWQENPGRHQCKVKFTTAPAKGGGDE